MAWRKKNFFGKNQFNDQRKNCHFLKIDSTEQNFEVKHFSNNWWWIKCTNIILYFLNLKMILFLINWLYNNDIKAKYWPDIFLHTILIKTKVSRFHYYKLGVDSSCINFLGHSLDNYTLSAPLWPVRAVITLPQLILAGWFLIGVGFTLYVINSIFF